ncbi:TetR/AcrR family transcriptional regulator [uncultured Brachybacterium sp.]|uniref:TetR/AcrR family transcriptional regulator n=1 Tax=uncultured Brachybacterium sp. TaxID=189680 RepID=UPI002628682F|nr:TetR/AcrR family transcriptional regulator [uncultured Brachybacterium sp.]
MSTEEAPSGAVEKRPTAAADEPDPAAEPGPSAAADEPDPAAEPGPSAAADEPNPVAGPGPSAAAAPRIGRAGSYSKGIARRQEILDRAIEVFRRRGADGTSLRRIAETIGISHGALLHYFSSREELLVAVYEHAEYRRDLERGDQGHVRSVDVMANAALANLEVPGLVQLYSTLVATSLEAEAGPAKEYFTTRFEQVRTDLEQRLRKDQINGLVRDDVDPARTAALIVAASDGLQIQWLLEPSIALQETLETFAVLLAP